MLKFSHVGDAETVFGNIARSRDDRAAGRISNYRPLLMVLGGGFGGAPGGGLAIPFTRNYLMRGLEVAFGNSVGSAIVAYAADCDQGLSEEPDRMKEVASIFYEECTNPALVSYRRWVRGGYGFDVQSVCDLFRDGPKRINQARARKCPAKIVSAVSEYESARIRLIYLTDFEDMVDGIRAAIHIPSACPGSVDINGRGCVEAAACDPLPIREVVGTHGPFTDIVVFMNRSPEYKLSWYLRQLEKRFALKGLPQRLQEKMLRREDAFRRRLHFLRRKCCANLVEIFNEDVALQEQDPRTLRDAVESGEDYMENLLRRAGV